MAGISRLLAQTSHLAEYRESEDGSITLHLSPDLPAGVAESEPAFVADMLALGAALGHQVPAVSSMDILCHTGGPKILCEVGRALEADDSQLAASWEVMQAHGNLSGASNLAVLDRHCQLPGIRGPVTRDWAVGLAMGPGVCLEGVLLRRVSGARDTCLSRLSLSATFTRPSPRNP